MTGRRQEILALDARQRIREVGQQLRARRQPRHELLVVPLRDDLLDLSQRRDVQLPVDARMRSQHENHGLAVDRDPHFDGGDRRISRIRVDSVRHPSSCRRRLDEHRVNLGAARGEVLAPQGGEGGRIDRCGRHQRRGGISPRHANETDDADPLLQHSFAPNSTGARDVAGPMSSLSWQALSPVARRGARRAVTGVSGRRIRPSGRAATQRFAATTRSSGPGFASGRRSSRPPSCSPNRHRRARARESPLRCPA